MADWRSYFAGRYLSGPVLTQDLTATIARIESTLVEDPDGGAARERMTIYFEGDVKPWLPCKTTGFCVAAMYGDDDAGWIGKPVTLYFDPTVKVGRDVKGGIRVRGAPGIKPITVTVNLPKRKPLTIRLVDTAPPRRDNRPPSPASLLDVLTAAGATMAAADAWAVQRGKPPVSSLDDAGQRKTAAWLTGAGSAVLAEIVAMSTVAPTATDPQPDTAPPVDAEPADADF